jgi:hypothetical protein
MAFEPSEVSAACSIRGFDVDLEVRADIATLSMSGWLRPLTTTTAGFASNAPHRDRVGRLGGLGTAVHPRGGFPDDFPVPLPEGKDVFGDGGAAIIEPTKGDVIAGPLYGE